MAEKTINTKIKQRYDTSANWASKNPILLAGELGIESDTNKVKYGNGITVWNNLDYANANDPTKEPLIKNVVTKTSIVDADTLPISDSATSGATKKVTFAVIKATLKTYFDTLYNKYYLYNDNLLNNSNLLNPINQRNKTLYNTDGYCIDRWQLINGSIYNVTTHIIDGSTNSQFRQPIIGLKLNQVYSFSLKINGEIISGSGVFDSVSANSTASPFVVSYPWGGIKLFRNTDTYFYFIIVINKAFSVDIEWAKLEEGNFSTEYKAKSYSEELNDCLVYFERIGTSDSGFLTDFGYHMSTSTFHQGRLSYHLKRIPPTVSFNAPNNYRVLFYSPAGGALAGNVCTTIGADQVHKNFCKLYCYFTAYNTSCYCMLQRNDSPNNAWIDISADL